MKFVKILLVILCACSATSMFGQDKSTSTGSMQLKIDVSDDNGTDAITQIVTLKKLKASEIEPFIRARLSRYGAVHVNDATNTIIITDKPLKVKDLASLVLKLDETGSMNFLRLETEAIKLNNILPSTIRPYVLRRLSAEGTVDINDALNLLIITDLRSRIENIKSFIPQFDIMPKQTMIEFKLYDITKLKNSDLGINPDWLLNDGTHSYVAYEKSNDDYYQTVHGKVVLSPIEYLLDQKAENKEVNLLANPSILVQNRSWGEISSTVDYYSFQDIAYFKVYPTITEANIIGMNVKLEFEGVNSSMNFFESTVTTTAGKTAVVGKLLRTVTSTSRKGIPGLKDIPVLRYLFSREYKTTENRKILILATPYIYEPGKTSNDTIPNK